MAKIHWLAYVIVGLFISIASWINYSKLILFFYTGLLFVLVGVVKLVFEMLNKKSNETPQQKRVLSQHHYALQNKNRIQAKRCHKCGNVMRLHDRFCGRCGSPLQ